MNVIPQVTLGAVDDKRLFLANLFEGTSIGSERWLVPLFQGNEKSLKWHNTKNLHINKQV